jgi:hypothetical protein
MIACISPGSSSADHSINTLRYADRLKENKPVLPLKEDQFYSDKETDVSR